jgi:hypothetical protein
MLLYETFDEKVLSSGPFCRAKVAREKSKVV